MSYSTNKPSKTNFHEKTRLHRNKILAEQKDAFNAYKLPVFNPGIFNTRTAVLNLNVHSFTGVYNVLLFPRIALFASIDILASLHRYLPLPYLYFLFLFLL